MTTLHEVNENEKMNLMQHFELNDPKWEETMKLPNEILTTVHQQHNEANTTISFYL